MPEPYKFHLTVSKGFFKAILPDHILQNEKFKKSGNQFYAGFILPKDIISYHCDECGQNEDEAPGIEVYIHFNKNDKPKTNVNYICNNCGELFASEYLESPEGIPPEYIKFDETGEYRLPTKEEIEDALKRANDDAEKGHGMSLGNPVYTSFLERALRWAEKINHEIPKKRIEEIETTFREAYLRNAQENFPELIKEIKQNAYGFSLSEADDYHVTPYEGTGLCELIDRFHEVLPLIDIPEDPEIRKDVIRILNTHKKMHEEEIYELREEEASIKRQIGSVLENVTDIDEMMSSYLKRTGLGEEDVHDAGLLSTFPGDYDEE
jgi:hypothetical protein